MNAFPLVGLLCPLLLVGVFVVAIVATIRALNRRALGNSGPSSAPPLQVPTQLEQDGFWILSCPADPGAMIYYHYWSGGARHSGQVPFQPEADGRQFVYTGRAPEQVSVARIVEVDDDPTGSMIPPAIAAASMWEPSDTFSTPSSPPPASSSFPSAY